MSSTYSHLDTATQAIVGQSDERRIEHIQRDRFIMYRALENILQDLNSLMTRPDSIRPPCIALVGDAGSGKSSLLVEFQWRWRLRADSNQRRVVYFVADAFPQLAAMQVALLSALDVPQPQSGYRRIGAATDVIQRSITELRVRVVIIDEIHHLMNLTSAARTALWDWIKWLSTACRVSVVCSGIPGSEEVIVRERQLNTRFEIKRLPRWAAGPALAQFLTALERSLPLRRASGLGEQSMQETILRESRLKQQVSGITHGIMQIVECAAIQAIQNGQERVSPTLLRAWRSPFDPSA